MTKRLIRYWLFNGLAAVSCIALYFFHSVIHAVGSSVSASFAVLGPRYLISGIGFYYLVIFITGIIFFAFDIRSRDERERMLEVLDSRPYSNLDLVIGRFLGLLLATWLPVVYLVLLIQGLGWLLPTVGSAIGSTIEPWSLFSFPFVIALPAIAFGCATVIFVTLLVRQRFVAIALSIAIVLGLYALSTRFLPYSISSAIDLLGFYQVNIPSDWQPSLVNEVAAWLQRLGLLVVTVGLLFFAALVHPRLDTVNSKVKLYGAVAAMAVGLLLLGSVYQMRSQQIEQLAQWRQAHEAKAQQPVVDIISVKGKVDIAPGDTLAAQLQLQIKVDQNLSNVLFTLNPGLQISAVKDANDNTLDYRFDNGLLDVTLAQPLAKSATTTLQLSFAGRPNLQFAYLDSAIDQRDLSFEDANIALLGGDNAIFDSGYVALMPGIHWLPSAGVDIGKDDLQRRARDFYTLDLEVAISSGWTVAGPGLRQQIEEGKYRFAPKVAISQTALIAAPFARYATNIDGIEFELLLHPDHVANIEVMAPAKARIESWISDKLALNREVGLNYPFGTFSLVEVPNTLRGYSGGWRMDTTLAQPGMVLMKETGFPTVRFDFDATEVFGQGRPMKDEQDGAAKVLTQRLLEFFANDFTGGNLFTGVGKSFFAFRTVAGSDEAIALNYTMAQLAALVLSEQNGYFSVARVAELANSMDKVLGLGQNSDKTITSRIIDLVTSDPQVWESAAATSLNNIKPQSDYQLTVDLLALKAGGVANIIYDVLGAKRSGQLLATLLAEHNGGSYTLADVVKAVQSSDSDLAAVLPSWYTTTGLSGFTSDKVDLFQLPQNRNGDTRYQLLVQLSNDEKNAGYTRLSWINEQGQSRVQSAPIRVDGQSSIEFGVVLSKAPIEVFVEPYLSLNRKDFIAKRFNLAEIPSKDLESFAGVRPVAWDNQSDGTLVLDDLQLVASENNPNNSSNTMKMAFDGGIPLSLTPKIFPARWSRVDDNTAWGKYRHTYAYVRPGQGNNTINIAGKLTENGNWALDVHLPNVNSVTNKLLGEYELEISSDNGKQKIAFDAKNGVVGWNRIGRYPLPKGKVSVTLSDKTNGVGVILDAIKWSLADEMSASN